MCPPSAAPPPTVDWPLEDLRFPSGSSAPGRTTTGKPAAASDGPAGRHRAGCRSRARRARSKRNFAIFSNIARLHFRSRRGGMSEGRSAQCDHQRPCRLRRRGQSQFGRRCRCGVAGVGTTHGSFVGGESAFGNTSSARSASGQIGLRGVGVKHKALSSREDGRYPLGRIGDDNAGSPPCRHRQASEARQRPS